MDDELRQRLRDAALAHRPDRERMLARVERGIAEGRPARTGRASRPFGAPMPWLRVSGATAAVCGVLAAGTLAVTSAVDDNRGAGRVSGPASPSSTAPAPRPSLPAQDGPLRSDGAVNPNSNRYWAQSEVTVRTAEVLSELTVELWIAQTGGVNSTGSWRSLPVEDFTVSARETSGFLVYRWTLKPGRTVPVGTHTFAGQYNHAEGARDAEGDAYTARARSAGQRAAVGGAFTPAAR
ncbi:hypothetical protein F0344_28960 [Streptomyces finlayi]|uniref:Uncharacterized protein n=1 Tax=Streptomyces finlayi TaxID=67296 RepID=A0A7G7BRX5_9ACTN|nr:hypothetical protein [Streptomyces finlayi]QNE78090.1 hypothetical protein F0344_28960 [Streptomyces finlayi]